MHTYWATHLQAATAMVPKTQPATIIVDDFDLYCQTLLTHKDSKGWQAELRRYLKDVPADISRDTDIVEYWQDHCQLQIMKFAWHSKTTDIAAINSQHVKEINVEPFQELLGEDHDFKGWDKDGLFVDDLDVDL
ncbi:hypothetical protein H0H87_001655 [Tephrocybe sp. NHM501043]|nr:hypothetical protein H0H87_001655 [Tephrocybe sp. NHM501043]